MNIEQLVQTAVNKYQKETSKFYSYIISELINNIAIFSLLEKKKDLEVLTKSILEANSKPHFSTFLPRNENILEKLKDLSLNQQKILSCPIFDEHVLFLAALKGLNDLKETNLYNFVLKDILKKSLHKLENIYFDSPFVGRKNELQEIKGVLSRNYRNNVLLIGDVGVGKTTLVKALKHFSDINIFQLFSGSEVFFDQVVNVLSSNTNKKKVFFLDEIFSFDTNQIKYLIDNSQIIGTSNDASFKKFLHDYPHLISKFEIIKVKEPSENELKIILSFYLNKFCADYNLKTSTDFLNELIKLAKRYIDGVFPAKGISLIDEITFKAKIDNVNIIDESYLKSFISKKINIPIDSLSDMEKKDLSNLAASLKLRLKGQDEAVDKVAKVFKRFRLGFKKPNKPIASFLLVGPSGVGKTELAKAVAQEFFGDEEGIVRLDMSEFSEAHMVQRLIGSPPGYIGYEEGGQLTNPVKEKPYNLILLDEIEKGHSKVFDLFLQVLDDGRLTDGQGKKVDFRNTIVMATSNAGIEDILDLIEEGKDKEEISAEIKEILQDYFRIEFINRFDEIIVFNALDINALKDIAINHINRLKEQLKERNINLNVSDEFILNLATKSNDPKFGARGLIRLIEEKIENELAEMIISGSLKEGETINF